MWVWLLLHLRFIPDEPEIMASPHWLVLPIFMEVPICLFTKLKGIGLFTDFGIYGWKCYNIYVQCFKWLRGFLFIYFSGANLRRRIFRIYEVRWRFSFIKAALNFSRCPQWRQQCHTPHPQFLTVLLPFYDKLVYSNSSVPMTSWINRTGQSCCHWLDPRSCANRSSQMTLAPTPSHHCTALHCCSALVLASPRGHLCEVPVLPVLRKDPSMDARDTSEQL